MTLTVKRWPRVICENRRPRDCGRQYGQLVGPARTSLSADDQRTLTRIFRSPKTGSNNGVRHTATKAHLRRKWVGALVIRALGTWRPAEVLDGRWRAMSLRWRAP